MKIGQVPIDDTFAEAFRMVYGRLVITAAEAEWARIAAREATGFGSSVIGCDVEAGVELELIPEATPDNRPGVSALFFGFNAESLGKSILTRVGQCVLTCPSTAVYDGLPGEEPETVLRYPLGRQLRFFGDGFQRSKLLGGRRYWRVPVMDGEFVVEEDGGIRKGIAGGNFLIQSRDPASGLRAARAAVEAIAALEGVITPFPGGVARSGSKVGSRYRALKASTNDAFCPTLRGRVASRVHPEAHCVYEIIINGVSDEAIRAAMRRGVHAACGGGDGDGVVAISAGNYGGRLGKFHFPLREVLA